MKKTIRGLAISLALACGMTASAATVVNYGGQNCSAGICTSVNGANQVTFDDATGTSPYVSGNATYTFSPDNASPFRTLSASGAYAAPPNDDTQYLSVGSPSGASTVWINFANSISYFGMYLGSPDSYNVISFYGTNNQLIEDYTGSELVAPGQGDQSVGVYVNFLFDTQVSRIEMSSNQAAFETDNHAYITVVRNDDPGAVPEPSTMGLMGGALAGIALVFRRRNSVR